MEKYPGLEMMDMGQPSWGREQLLQKIQDLRVEMDALRLQNQTLHIELDRVLHLSYWIRRIIKTYWRDIYCKGRQIKNGIVRKARDKKPSNYSSNFRPYQVQPLQPLQPNRPRVLHAIGNCYTGGSTRLIVDLVEHLGHRYEQEITTRDKPDVPGYVGLKIHHYKRFTRPHQVLSHLKKFRPDIIHVHYLGHLRDRYGELNWKWYNHVFQAAQAFGCKIIENVNIPVEPYVSDTISCYVYVSDYVRHEFGRLDSRNITIYPGSDLTLFSRKNEVDIPDDCIGMVYRLEGDKLNGRSIDVFLKVVQRRPRTKVLIVGGGRYLEAYRNAVHRLGVGDRFTFTGYVSYEELPAFYERMSVFVAPVHRESFGQVSPFAMGMGIPVVGYSVGALEEIVGDRELLAPPGDSDTLANVIVELLNDRERRLRIGEGNRRRARQLFSVEAMINSYSTLYDEMMTSPKVV